MSQRTKYRKEVHRRTRMPDDGDHYALAVHPPLNRDDVYCRVYCEGRNWGGSAKPLESRDAAVEYIQDKLDELEEKATDDKNRGSVSYYPEPPKPANTRYVVHPDFDGEIGPREVWGDATLASFGVQNSSKYEDQQWYETREEFQDWLAPLREAPGAQVVRIYAQDLTEMAYWWAMLDNDTETLHWIRYRPNSDRLNVSTTTWTSATRTVGGIGTTHAPPADLRHFVVSKTPYLAGVEEADVRDYIESHDIEPLEKSGANQIDTGDDVPGRHSGGASA